MFSDKKPKTSQQTYFPMPANNIFTTLLMITLHITLLTGCASSQETEKTITLEEPKVVNAVIVDEKQAEQLKEAEAAAATAVPNKAEPAASDIPEPAVTIQAVPPEGTLPAEMPAEALNTAAQNVLPPDSTKLIALPKLSKIEISEISDQLVMNLGAKPGYGVSLINLPDSLPRPPAGTIGDMVITRPIEGDTAVLRYGYRHFVTQPPQLWVLGVIIGQDGKLSPNPDLALIEPEITKMIASLTTMRAGLTVRDLEAKLIQLSYVDTVTAITMLQGFGITTGPVPPIVDFTKLPYVVEVKDPAKEYTGLVGANTKSGSSILSLTPGTASDLGNNTIATPMTQLMVLFHPAHPEQFSEVRKALDEYIDRPARQIFIEGMVLEIGEQGLDELGIDWQLRNDNAALISGTPAHHGGAPLINASGGVLSAGVGTQILRNNDVPINDTLNINIPNTEQLFRIFNGQFQWNWSVNIQALIREGKAEILSRPSVLTLNNRQSTIRVGKDVPIATSMSGGLNNYASSVKFEFQYLPTGILLNIRPRINENGTEVTMLIDTIVSAEVPGEELTVVSRESVILASAPTVSTRRVQTYARIANNTPLIIGGLVANEKIMVKDKIPLLGDLPLLGFAFRSERVQSSKREVIIVLTPHVLPEEKEVRMSFPKDEDFFDSFGNDLFRDSYRIRSEDVFDLTFLLENERIASYRNKAREAAGKNFRLGEVEPYRSFVKDSIPGESSLVTRMIYEVIKRLNIEDPIKQSRMIYFGSQQVGGYDVEFLDKIVKGENDGVRDFGGKALALTFHYDSNLHNGDRLGSEPIPEVKEVDCADRKEWGTKLWELNQPAEDGCERHTILIKDESDIVRLRRALALKKIAVLNGGDDHMRLKNFSVGKTLLMPEMKDDQIHVIDADTAKFFFHTEHYYAATLKEIEEHLKELDEEFKRPEINVMLDSEMPGNGSATQTK